MKIDDEYEYPHPFELKGDACAYFLVPSAIVLDKDIGDKRMTAFSFFSVKRGIDGKVDFSVNRVVQWSGRTPNRNANGINAKMSGAIESLADNGYLAISDDYEGAHVAEACFNLFKVFDECSRERFAVVYVDEIKRIMDYDGFEFGDRLMSNDVVLLVFAYLRMMIYRRRNKLHPEEVNVDDLGNRRHDVAARRARNPEAYSGYYCDIADDLGLSPRVASKSIGVLEELGLIYSEPLPRTKIGDKWVTNHSIFCNAYKREGKYLLDEGTEYCLREAGNKKNKINAFARK